MIVYKMKAGQLIDVGFYMNIIICALLVFSLATGDKIIKINKVFDKAIGDYAYPIYLLHWQCGLLASYLIFGEAFHELSIKGLVSFVLALAIALLISYLTIRAVDRPVQRIRSKIKSNLT